MMISGARGELNPEQEKAKETFIAAYRELLQRPPQTGSLDARAGKTQLTWHCSHAGFQMSHPELGTFGMIRDRRSSTGYRIMVGASRGRRNYLPQGGRDAFSLRHPMPLMEQSSALRSEKLPQ
jgi:hypothetical protein